MRVLGPVVRAEASVMEGGEPHRTKRCRIGSQVVGHDPGWRGSVFLQQLHHQFHCDFGVATALDQKIEYLAVVIDGPPKPVLITADHDYHLVEVPVVARPRPRASDVRCNGQPKLDKPPSYGLVGDIDAPLGEQFLDVPE